MKPLKIFGIATSLIGISSSVILYKNKNKNKYRDDIIESLKKYNSHIKLELDEHGGMYNPKIGLMQKGNKVYHPGYYDTAIDRKAFEYGAFPIYF
jgi:hypothetical protein